MTELHDICGRITDLHRAAMHDGPGIRTTVFLKGCPLRCVWCHNPETWIPDRQIGFAPAKCTLCRACQMACPRGCHKMTTAGHGFDRTACTSCAACTRACAEHSGSRALIAWGRDTTAGVVVTEAARDCPYYRRSGGGLTISGGEPLAQPLFAEALLRLARDQGIHTCLDTSGYASLAVFQRLAPLADLLLFDLKADHARHRELTGVALDPILANLDWALANGVAVHLRCPLVPGLNDDEVHLARIADYAGRPGVVSCDVMPYHRYGADKWTRLGMHYPLAEQADASAEDEQRWRQALVGTPVHHQTLYRGPSRSLALTSCLSRPMSAAERRTP